MTQREEFANAYLALTVLRSSMIFWEIRQCNDLLIFIYLFITNTCVSECYDYVNKDTLLAWI